MFRFSLRTLILLSFWAGTAMLVWQSRRPWNLVEVVPRTDNVAAQVVQYARPPNIYDTVANWAPDNRRLARMNYALKPRSGFLPFQAIPNGTSTVTAQLPKDAYLTHVEILDYKVWPTLLANLEIDEFVTEFNFTDDNHLECKGIKHDFTFRRNHPEWWWGHFSRVELWLLVVLTLALAITFVRHIRAWRRALRAARV